MPDDVELWAAINSGIRNGRKISRGEGLVASAQGRQFPIGLSTTVFRQESQETPEGTMTARRVWICEVQDGRIAEVVGYCNGGWDDDLRARHEAEAPIVRP